VSGTTASELPQLFEEVFALRDRPRLVDLAPADHTVGVDDEGRALVEAALFVEDAESLADLTVGPVVGKEGEGNAAELLGPGFETGNRIGADLQNLDVQLSEFFVVRTEPADLILSSPGEGHRQEADDGGPPAEGPERDFLVVVVCGEREIGRRAAGLQGHLISPGSDGYAVDFRIPAATALLNLC
jgi:hypothetical protein